MPDEQQPIGWTPLLVMVCIAVTIGTVIPVGYALGVVNTTAEFIKVWSKESLETRYGIKMNEIGVDMLWSSVVALLPIGGICGSFVASKYSKKFGRKWTLIISIVLLLVGGILFAICHELNSVGLILLGRCLVGVAAAFIYTTQPMYLLEITPIHLRGSAGVFTSIGITGGIVVGQICSLNKTFGTATLWQYALSFYSILVVLSCLPFYWFPESPRWLLLTKGNLELTKVALQKLRGKSVDEATINKEIGDMKNVPGEDQEVNDLNFFAVLRNSEFTLPLVIVCSFTMCQQMSGVNAIFFYSVSIFTKGGFEDETAAWMNFAGGVLNFVCSCISFVIMGKFNRRTLMLISCGGCTVSLIILTIGLRCIEMVSWFPQLCMVGMSLYFIFFNVGFGQIPFFIGVELFEVEPRPVAMSMGNLFSWTGNFMIGMFFPILEVAIGAYCFLLCAGCCLTVFLMTWFYLPETRGRQPKDVKALVANGFRSKVKE